MSHIIGKTGRLYLTVNEQLSSKLRNHAPADVIITDYYSGRPVIIVSVGGMQTASAIRSSHWLAGAAGAPFHNTGKAPEW